MAETETQKAAEAQVQTFEPGGFAALLQQEFKPRTDRAREAVESAVATLAAHAATPAIGGMLHLSLTLTLATAMPVAHATAISRSPCLGSASGDQAGRSQGQGEEIECFHAVVPVGQIMGWINRPATS